MTNSKNMPKKKKDWTKEFNTRLWSQYQGSFDDQRHDIKNFISKLIEKAYKQGFQQGQSEYYQEDEQIIRKDEREKVIEEIERLLENKTEDFRMIGEEHPGLIKGIAYYNLKWLVKQLKEEK